MTERKFKRVKKYHYSMVKICNETDQVFTRCYVCGEWKPSTQEYFKREADPNRDRDIRPICKHCVNEQLKDRLKRDKEKKEMESMKQISKETVHTNPLFEEDNETVESKLDRLLTYLWLK